MPDLFEDTRVEAESPGVYPVSLSPDWAVWGPNGGYMAALALRAALAESRFSRPASFHCHFLAVGAFEPARLEVQSLGGGKRAESLRVDLRQGDRLLLTANVWTTHDELGGYEHDEANPPQAPSWEMLPPYSVLAGDEYDDWYPIWRSIEGRPLSWGPQPPADPHWYCWLRLTDTPIESIEADAVRQLFWLDMPGWNATTRRHPWPFPYLTPNLDLNVQFHRFAPEVDWMLAEGRVPIANDGVLGCTSRVWSEDGRLLATGTSKHSCRPNPTYEEQLAEARQQGLLDPTEGS